jgi:hypothetical protein
VIRPIILVVALTAPAAAKEKCTSMCHFYEAWALAKLCPKLMLNEDGAAEDKADSSDRKFSRTHAALKRQVLGEMRHATAACNIDCKWDKEVRDELEGTPCQYLRLKEPL